MNRLLKLSIILIFFIGQINAQERMITGKVTDLMGNPLAGVNVAVKDYPTIMTITGADGEYRIEAFDFSKALIFSFAGMKTKEVPIGEINRIEAKMSYLPFKNPNPYSIAGYIRPVSTKFQNEAVANDQYWRLESRMGGMMELNINYFITNNLGFGTGAAIGLFKSNMYLTQFDNYGENYIERTDKDGDLFYLYNSGANVDERTEITTLSIPLMIKYQIRQDKKLGFFVDLGLRIMYIVDAHINAQVNTEMYAYYPQYHVVVDNLPEYGIVDMHENIEKDIESFEAFNISMAAAIGASLKVGKNLHFDFGAYFEYGLTDMGFREPQYNTDFLSTIGVEDKTSIRGIGASLGIRYDIIRKK